MSTLVQRINIDSTFGACLMGAQIDAMLYGLTTLQSYFYYVSYPEDSTKTKASVCIIWLLDSLQTGFVSMGMYHYLVTNYDNPSNLAIIDWSLCVPFGIHILIKCIVETFFAIQIFRLTRSRVRWWLISIIGISIVAPFCFGIVTLALLVIKKEFVKALEGISYDAAIAFAISAVFADILIACSLCVLLRGRQTNVEKTNTIVTTLIIYAINRCLLTSVATVTEVIMFMTMPHSLWFLVLDMIMGKFYANSLLASLNSRQSIREKDASPTHLTDIKFVEPTGLTSNSRPKTDTGDIVLDIHRESIPLSSWAQSHASANDRMSSVAPYKV